MIQTQPASVRLATVVTLGRLGFEGPASAESARLLSQPKRVAVLLYVLMSQRGGSTSRDQLIGTFWPESDSARARNALRQSLSFLRSCLGDEALIGIGSHGVTVTASVACDAVQFEALLDANRKEEALGLYGGELLPGFYNGGSFAFTEWLERRRQHLSQRAAKAAWDLSAECEARADLPGAAFWGKRALALSPFSESEVQRLLRLLERTGDFAGAMRAFRGLQSSLETEFGTQPSGETIQLAAGIKRRLESEGLHIPVLLGTRRSSADRRVAERRSGKAPWTGIERRSVPDRRNAARRSGVDRRAVREIDASDQS
ncbi:MAG: BTAD domain-containing putative transcriptional regulator [Gemmatimonadaceae bacterium]|nr:BTAD domain-containing putative transcriptional regulator [Gemmatimonadaceae bacterium]